MALPGFVISVSITPQPTSLYDFFSMVDTAFSHQHQQPQRKALYKFICKLLYTRDLTNPNSITFDHVLQNRSIIESQFANAFANRVPDQLDLLAKLVYPQTQAHAPTQTPSQQPASTSSYPYKLKDLFGIVANKVTPSSKRQALYEFIRKLIKFRDRVKPGSDTVQFVIDNIDVIKQVLRYDFSQKQIDEYMNLIKQVTI